jgi:hypothetical protein
MIKFVRKIEIMPGINELFRLRDNHSPLILEVHIGHAGKAATIVTLNSQPLNGLFIDSFHFEFGKDTDLNGKELHISSMVSKTQPGNDHSSVSITMRGGFEDKTFPMDDQSALNPVDYRATITLIL